MHAHLVRISIAVFLFVFIQLPPAAANDSRQFPSFLQPCGELDDALCGTYSVWENRQRQSGRRIDLNLVVLPAAGPGPHGPAIFPLAGGPGQGATQGVGFARTMFGPLQETRDIVLLDQRGTGQSHSLACAAPGDTAPLAEILEDFRNPDFARECRESLDADVRHYTTEEAVGDLDEIREALGYDRIDLVGGSYGTRVALHYMRRFPEGVRAVVLDGVAPPSSPYVAVFSRALEQTLQSLFLRCSEDPACREAIPDPEADWRTALARFDAGTLATEVTHPGTGERETVTLVRGEFVDGIRRSLYGLGSWSRVLRIIQAAGDGDFDPFIEQEVPARLSIHRGLSLGMLLSVSCSENLPSMTEEAVREATRGTALGDHRARMLRQACAGWEFNDPPPDWATPVRSDAPVLMLSGEVDPATPPWVAAEVATHLPRSRHVIIPNRSHQPADLDCESRVVQRFLETGNLEDLDTTCLEETPWPPFELASGPTESITVDATVLDTYAGKYEVQAGFVVEIRREGTDLFVFPPGQPRELMKPVSEDTFFVTGIGQTLVFLRNPEGDVDRFQLRNGPTAKRID